ncbi:MAG TPA: hypothetical protein VNK43_05535 [Gemmatimonadales bacterium]|nr:hypothetical protein [Gemmatimonadales bacterium]
MSVRGGRGLALGATLALATSGVEAQRAPPGPAQPSPGCLLEIVHADSGVTIPGPGGTVNYFARGDVQLRCRGQEVSMRSDSVAATAGRIFEFIGRVRYRDSTIEMDADRGTYFRDGERWEARGRVFTRNLRTGSTLRGPSLDYYRAIPGQRDTAMLYAVGRPRIEYVTTDSAGRRGEPYVIHGDRVRMRGEDRLWAGGKVTIDRSDFAARGDSLRLDAGPAGDGSLLGGLPTLRGLGPDSFRLEGRRIDFRLDRRELTYLVAKGQGHAVNASWDLRADTIALDIEGGALVQTLAWGDSLRPHADSPEHEIRADSLALDTPGRRLREARAFGAAWVGTAPDSATGERDWLSGDTVVAQFAQRDSAGTTRSVLRRIEARHEARSFYRVSDPRRPGPPSLNYSRGDRIVVTMKPGDDRAVERVDLYGRVDGVQLEPVRGESVPAPPEDRATGGRR